MYIVHAEKWYLDGKASTYHFSVYLLTAVEYGCFSFVSLKEFIWKESAVFYIIIITWPSFTVFVQVAIPLFKTKLYVTEILPITFFSSSTSPGRSFRFSCCCCFFIVVVKNDMKQKRNCFVRSIMLFLKFLLNKKNLISLTS